MEMIDTTAVRPTPRWMFWTGWVLSAIPILFMGVGGIVFAALKPQMVREGMTHGGYPESVAPWIIGVEIACAVVYAIPRTAVLGAVLLTGYLGGATATHVRIGEPWVFPVIFGVIVWLGLFLREPRVRALLPLRQL